MHELGILVHIVKTINQIADENELKEIGSITLEVGEVSAIIPHYLTDCWEFYKKKFDRFKSCELKIEMIKGVTQCEDCQKTYDTVTYGKVCPYCHSSHTYLIEGSECAIKQIEAQ